MTPGEPSADDLARARELVGDAERIVILTGAGVSAESGIPTFRGSGGMWKSYRPEELATPDAFRRDPRTVWEWYQWRRSLVADCDPNPAHLALARLALRDPGRTVLVTQNVDGLHHRAARAVSEATDAPGETAQSIAETAGATAPVAYPLEVHGAIHRDRCSSCGVRDEHPRPVDATSVDSLPRCPECDGLMRPDVVWFGERLDPDVIGAAMEAARAADLCLVVGTSAVVHPAASVPEVTRQGGGRVVEINLEPTPVTSYAAVSLHGEAGKLVPPVLDTTD